MSCKLWLQNRLCKRTYNGFLILNCKGTLCFPVIFHLTFPGYMSTFHFYWWYISTEAEKEQQLQHCRDEEQSLKVSWRQWRGSASNFKLLANLLPHHLISPLTVSVLDVARIVRGQFIAAAQL